MGRGAKEKAQDPLVMEKKKSKNLLVKAKNFVAGITPLRCSERRVDLLNSKTVLPCTSGRDGGIIPRSYRKNESVSRFYNSAMYPADKNVGRDSARCTNSSASEENFRVKAAISKNTHLLSKNVSVATNEAFLGKNVICICSEKSLTPAAPEKLEDFPGVKEFCSVQIRTDQPRSTLAVTKQPISCTAPTQQYANKHQNFSAQIHTTDGKVKKEQSMENDFKRECPRYKKLRKIGFHDIRQLWESQTGTSLEEIKIKPEAEKSFRSLIAVIRKEHMYRERKKKLLEKFKRQCMPPNNTYQINDEKMKGVDNDEDDLCLELFNLSLLEKQCTQSPNSEFEFHYEGSGLTKSDPEVRNFTKEKTLQTLKTIELQNEEEIFPVPEPPLDHVVQTLYNNSNKSKEWEVFAVDKVTEREKSKDKLSEAHQSGEKKRCQDSFVEPEHFYTATTSKMVYVPQSEDNAKDEKLYEQELHHRSKVPVPCPTSTLDFSELSNNDTAHNDDVSASEEKLTDTNQAHANNSFRKSCFVPVQEDTSTMPKKLQACMYKSEHNDKDEGRNEPKPHHLSEVSNNNPATVAFKATDTLNSDEVYEADVSESEDSRDEDESSGYSSERTTSASSTVFSDQDKLTDYDSQHPERSKKDRKRKRSETCQKQKERSAEWLKTDEEAGHTNVLNAGSNNLTKKLSNSSAAQKRRRREQSVKHREGKFNATKTSDREMRDNFTVNGRNDRRNARMDREEFLNNSKSRRQVPHVGPSGINHQSKKTMKRVRRKQRRHCPFSEYYNGGRSGRRSTRDAEKNPLLPIVMILVTIPRNFDNLLDKFPACFETSKKRRKPDINFAGPVSIDHANFSGRSEISKRRCMSKMKV